MQGSCYLKAYLETSYFLPISVLCHSEGSPAHHAPWQGQDGGPEDWKARYQDYPGEEALKDQPFSNVSAIGVDEYSHKVHNSITVFLSHPDKLTNRQHKRLGQLLEIEYLDTVQSYSEEMIVAFAGMASKFANSPGREIRKFAACLTRNAVEILNSLQTLRTNAILQGFNAKIRIIKSRARGCKSMKNFMHMTYFVCGELSLSLQPIM